MFELKTIVFLLMLSNLVIALFLLTYYFLNKEHSHKYRLYITSKLIQAVSWLFVMSRPDIPVFWSAVLGNSFLFIGLSLEIYVLVTANKGFMKKLISTLLIMSVLAAILLIIFYEPTFIRYALRSIFLASFFMYGGFQLGFGHVKSKMQVMAGIFCLIIAVLFTLNGLYYLIEQDNGDIYNHNTARITVNTIFFLLTNLLPFTFLLLRNEYHYKQLSAANAARNKLMAIISHDLKNPYQAIMGFAQMIMYDSHNKKFNDIEENSRIIYNSAKKSHDLLENVLHWAKHTTENISFNPELLVLSFIVQNIESLLSANLGEKKITFEKAFDTGFTIRADKFMLETILRNLISNAIKYSHQEGIIKLKAEKTKNYYTVCVIDNGTGLSQEKQSNLFKIGLESPKKGTSGEKGVGLGLIICKEFIEKHLGSIQIKSEEGKGSTFCFQLPVKTVYPDN